METAIPDCVYFQLDPSKGADTTGKTIHKCAVFRNCVTEGKTENIASCEGCGKMLSMKGSKFSKRFEDPLLMLDRNQQETHALRNLLAGGVSFLVVGGPSSRSIPIELLRQKGIFSLAVNNMAGSIWPNAFICSDPPSKFHNGIWLDPSVMKFVPIPKMGHGRKAIIREKVDGEFRNIEKRVGHCPNVWGYSRRAWLSPDHTFFTETDAAWGNHDAGVEKTGNQKTVCTMLLGMRILYYLGSRRIYLVGCDWHMNPDAAPCDNYAFGEQRDADAIRSNNDQYRIAGKWLEEMQKNGTFRKFGLEIYNCFQMSGLRAFAHVPFELAVKDALKGFPKQPFDLEDWYRK